MLYLRPLLLAAALAAPLLAAAQTPAPEFEPEQDPPGRVARLSYISGDVTFQSASSDSTEAASLNLPVTTGDRLTTGSAARSELTFGVAAVRLDDHTDLSISNLDDELAQLQLDAGTIAVHVRELENSQTVQIDAPHATVQLLEPGDYRVEVDSNGDLYVDVRSGEAEIDSGNRREQIGDGEQAYLAAGDERPDIRGLGAEDDFDRWAQDRERQLNGREATRYVSREVVGYEDLDGYGDWRTEPSYGAVWYPRVAVGWAPYRYGRWMWVAPWGWTWVDRSPWGFAPFHYGRWAYVSSRWCWVPGPRHYRPVYAPALVGWMGDPYRGGISLSISTGPIGWFPLGPREVYVPYRRVSPHYLRTVNVSNTVIVNNTYITNVAHNRVNNIRYVNRDAPNAVTRAPKHDFDSRRPSADRQWTVHRRDNDRRDRPGFARNGNDGNRSSFAARQTNNGNTVRQFNTDRPGNRPESTPRTPDRGQQGRAPDVSRDTARNDDRRDVAPRDRSRSDDTNNRRSTRTYTHDTDRRNSARSNPGAVQPSTERPRPPPQFQRDFDRSRENRDSRDSTARRERQPGTEQRPAPSQRNHEYRVPDRSREQAPRTLERPEPQRRETPPARPAERSRPQPEQRSEPRRGGAVQQGVPQNTPRGDSGDRSRGSHQRNERPR